MYNEHFGLSQSPFRITPDTGLFFTGAGRGEVLEALVYAITSGEGIIKVTGEVGTGKTMLCRMLEGRLPGNVDLVYLANPSLSPDDIVQAIALELGVLPHATGTRIELVFQLQQTLVQRHAENHRVVVLIEEAQSMPNETLEEVRLLSNLETKREKLLQVVLFGQPELDEKLATPEIRQLRERITHSFLLAPLRARDIRDYVNYRLRASGYRGRDAFSLDAFKAMGRASEGLTRRVNILADKALLAAYAEDTHDVARRHVKVAIKDSAFQRARKRRAFSMLAVLLVATAAAGIGWSGASWLNGGDGGRVMRVDATEIGDGIAAEGGRSDNGGLASTLPADVAQPAAGGAYESDAPGSDPLPTAAGADATRVRVTAGSDAASWGAAQSAAVVTPSAGPAANAATLAAGASIEARNRPALRDDASSAALVSVTSRQGVTPSPEPDPTTPGPLVRTLIAALSEGDSTMIAPPPVPETEQPANARPLDLEVRPAGSAPAAVAPSAADADAHASSPQDLPAPRDRQSPEVLQRGDLLEERLQVTENWLNRIDPKHYTIQLLATVAGERSSLLQFLDRQRQRNGLQDVYVYETYIGGRSWYSVVFGNFSSYSEARDALRGLPRDLARHSPFIRNLSDLRSRS